MLRKDKEILELLLFFKNHTSLSLKIFGQNWNMFLFEK